MSISTIWITDVSNSNCGYQQLWINVNWACHRRAVKKLLTHCLTTTCLNSCCAILCVMRVCHIFFIKYWNTNDVKRGQNLEAETEPRPGSWGRGRDRGQSFKVKAEAEAYFLRSRPRSRPKIKLGIKSIKWWLTTYIRIYFIRIKTKQFISHSLSHSNYLLS